MPTNRSSCESSTNDCTLVGRKSSPGWNTSTGWYECRSLASGVPLPALATFADASAAATTTSTAPSRATAAQDRLRGLEARADMANRPFGGGRKRSLVAILASATSSVHPRSRTIGGRGKPLHWQAVPASPPTGPLEPGQPFVVAHRAGNDLGELRAAEAAGARVVEADVYLHRDRLEVRHLKTAGPLPLLWDRWRVASAFRPRLLLPTLLRSLSAETALVLDLKGRDTDLPHALLDALDAEPVTRPVAVCAREWRLLDPLTARRDLRPVHSVGSRGQLEELRHRRCTIAGLAVHERLLDRATVRELAGFAEIVITWPVNTLDRARRLLDWGVHGLTTDRFAAVLPALERPFPPACPTS